ncbi:transcription antitermination factor NusB [Endothiovibrio diazotrophicus]
MGGASGNSPGGAGKGVRRPSHARHKARRYAVQALYQWEIAGDTRAEVERQFLDQQPFKEDEVDYFRELLSGVVEGREALDEALTPCLNNRQVEEVDPVERAVLRLATFELAHHPEIPYQVVINEAVDLTKTFGSPEGRKFVNAVLDHAARQLRPVEVKAAGR